MDRTGVAVGRAGRTLEPPAIELAVPTAPLVAAATFLVGMALRLPGLWNTPLGAVEARRAAEALDALRGTSVDVAAGPLLIYGQMLLFLGLTPSDMAARLLPWLAGAALPLATWPLRRHLGYPAAALASLFLALSPTLGFYSRFVGAAELATLGTLLLLAALYAERTPIPQPYLVGLLVGLTLACGPFGWLALLLMVVALAVAPGSGRPGLSYARLGALLARRAWLVAALTLLAVSTGLLSRPGGLQEGAIDAPVSLLERLFRAPTGGPWSTLPAVLIGYELVPTFLALLGLVTVGAGRSTTPREDAVPRVPLPSFISTWTIASLAVLALGFRAELEAAPLLVVPICLLAAVASADLWDDFTRLLRETAVLGLAAAMAFLMLLAGFVLSIYSTPVWPGFVPGAVVLLPFVLLAVFVGLAWLWTGRSATLGALTVVLVMGGVLLTARATWLLNVAQPANPSELLVVDAGTGDVQQLRDDLWTRWATLARGGRPAVQVAVAPALADRLAWYLRDFENVRYEEPATSRARVRIAPAPLPGTTERPRIYTLTTVEPAEPVGPFARLWRWLVYREPGGGQRGVVVYVYDAQTAP